MCMRMAAAGKATMRHHGNNVILAREGASKILDGGPCTIFKRTSHLFPCLSVKYLFTASPLHLHPLLASDWNVKTPLKDQKLELIGFTWPLSRWPSPSSPTPSSLSVMARYCNEGVKGQVVWLVFREHRLWVVHTLVSSRAAYLSEHSVRVLHFWTLPPLSCFLYLSCVVVHLARCILSVCCVITDNGGELFTMEGETA